MSKSLGVTGAGRLPPTAAPANTNASAPRRLRIPGVVDVVLVSDAQQIAWLNEHKALTRQLEARNGWLQRLIAARLLTDLRFHGKLLPVFLERDDHLRAHRKLELERRLADASCDWSEDVKAIAACLKQEPELRQLGAAVQRWCGKLFDADYRASGASYEAGRLIAGWASAPPWRSLAARASGHLDRAKALLWELADGDPHCVHATSIGTENIAKTLDNVRRAAPQTAAPRPTADALLRACLVAPPAVLRGCSERVEVPFLSSPLTPRSVVVFLVAKSFAGSGDIDAAFLASNGGSWSACPARVAVPQMLGAVLRQADLASSPAAGAAALDCTRAQEHKQRRV